MGRRDMSAERRVQIIAAAKRAIAQFGVEGATQERVSDEAGMSRPNIRHYIGNRDAVLDAVWDSTISAYIEQLRAATARESSPDALREALDAVLETVFSQDDDDTVLLAFIGESRRNARMRQRMSKDYSLIEAEVANLLRGISAESGQDDVDALAYTMVCLSVGAATLDMLNPGPPRAHLAISQTNKLVDLTVGHPDAANSEPGAADSSQV